MRAKEEGDVVQEGQWGDEGVRKHHAGRQQESPVHPREVMLPAEITSTLVTFQQRLSSRNLTERCRERSESVSEHGLLSVMTSWQHTRTNWRSRSRGLTLVIAQSSCARWFLHCVTWFEACSQKQVQTTVLLVIKQEFQRNEMEDYRKLADCSELLHTQFLEPIQVSLLCVVYRKKWTFQNVTVAVRDVV